MAPGGLPGIPPADKNSFHYRSRSGRRGRPRWIGPAQWVVFLLWAVFNWWLLLGPGIGAVVSAMAVFHGVYAFETALGAVVLPNWGLVTLPVLAILLWLQVLWVRYGESVHLEDCVWCWTGRRGPAGVEKAAGTLGGAWCRDDRRWYYVPGGLVNGVGESWCSVACRDAAVHLHPLRLASPALVFLIVLGLAAYGLQRPVVAYKSHLRAVRRDVFRSNPAALAILLEKHPEFRPFALYLSTLPACTKAACMKAQIAARLEMASIGPDYRADGATLIRLLILNGKGGLAMKLLGPDKPQSFDIAVREGRPGLARRILAANPRMDLGRNPAMYALLLLQEGRFVEAFDLLEGVRRPPSHNAVTEYAVAAYMSGHCRTVAEVNGWLLYPDRQAGVNLYGAAPPTGLGALQRVARDIKRRASYALGLAMEGDLKGSAREWRETEREARESGIPGLVNRDRILMGLVNPSALSG